jgi:hypothetical protein
VLRFLGACDQLRTERVCRYWRALSRETGIFHLDCAAVQPAHIRAAFGALAVSFPRLENLRSAHVCLRRGSLVAGAVGAMPPQWSDSLDTLKWLCNLRLPFCSSLSLTGTLNGHDEQSFVVLEMAGLRELRLENLDYLGESKTAQETALIQLLAPLQQLCTLRLRSVHCSLKVLAILSTLCALTELQIDGVDGHVFSQASLPPVALLPKLRVLRLGTLDWSGLCALCEMKFAAGPLDTLAFSAAGFLVVDAEPVQVRVRNEAVQVCVRNALLAVRRIDLLLFRIGESRNVYDAFFCSQHT